MGARPTTDRTHAALRALAAAAVLLAALVCLALAVEDAGGQDSVGGGRTGDVPPADVGRTGVDEFPSGGRINVTIDDVPGRGQVTEDIELSSAGLADTRVLRGPLQEGENGNGGTIQTEIVALQLRGESPLLGPVFVIAGSDYGLPPTRGAITGVRLDGDGGFASGDSFFDVFFQIDLPESPFGPVFVRNEEPVALGSQIFDLPPNRPEPSPDEAFELDHFKCYGVRQTRPPIRRLSKRALLRLRRGRRAKRRVGVVDQLERRRERTRRPVLLCNPVVKAFDGEVTRVQRSRDHLVCYSLAARRRGWEREAVGIKNQFGATTVDLVRRDVLCLPSRKRVVRGKHLRMPKPSVRRRLSHFKCYTARHRGEAKSFDVRLADQFERRADRVDGPFRLCNPASKNRSRVYNRFAHLTCHPFARRRIAPRLVAVRNQFGIDYLVVRRRDSLCLPTHKVRCSEYAEQAKVALMAGDARIGTVNSAIHVPFEHDPESACP